MEKPDNTSLPDKMNEFVWEIFPQFIFQKFSKRLGKTLKDGSYLTSLWKYIWLLAPLFFTAGLIIGGTHIFFVNDEVYTFSVSIMLFMIVPSVFSACFGFWLCLGYGIGDLFIYKYSFYLHQNVSLFDFILKAMLPRLIPIVFLYFLLVSIPAAGKNLASRILLKLEKNSPNRKMLEPLIAGLCAGLIAYAWTKSVPLLIRPVYAWQSLDMPGVSPPLYESGWIISLVTGMGVMARQFIEQVVTEKQGHELLFNTTGSLKDGMSTSQEYSFGHVLPLIIFTTIFSTFLLSGIYTGWYDALIFGAGILIASYLKLYFIPKQNGWVNMVERIPFMIRFLSGIIICWLFYKYAAAPISLHEAEQPDQQLFIKAIFKNILYTLLLSMIYYGIFFPDHQGSTKTYKPGI